MRYHAPMDISLIMPGRDTAALKHELEAVLPEVRIQVWPDIQEPEQVVFAVLWKPPAGAMDGMVQLRAVTSYGAGVDDLVDETSIRVPIGRIASPELAEQMTAYVLAEVLGQARELDRYRAAQAGARWEPRLEPVSASCHPCHWVW